MYEDMTFESIMQRMLERIPNTFDKREGSVIYDALAPAAIELQNAYIAMDVVLNESFADTQSRDYLIKRCAERNIYPKGATYAIRQGEFNIDVPEGSRFSLNQLNYVVTEKISDGVFMLQCETAGNDGNIETGTLIPIDTIDGLQTATLTDVLIPGEDEEDTEDLRQRYFDSFESQAFGGNVADYKEKVRFLDGVGGVKVQRTPNGGGTVKLVIIDSTFNAPSDELVASVQNAVDPIGHQGEGLGLAPIDHEVEVVGCGKTTVNIQTNIEFQEGWGWESIKADVETAIDDYFNELYVAWEDSGKNGLVVKTSQIEARLIDITGVWDVKNTTLNDATSNLTIAPDNIPVRGNLTNV